MLRALALLLSTFVVVAAQTASRDAESFAEARIALDKHNDCASAYRALSEVSLDGRNNPPWLFYMGKALECLGRPGAALRHYQRYHELMPGAPAEVLDKIGELKYAERKRLQSFAQEGMKAQQTLDLQARIPDIANSVRTAFSRIYDSRGGGLVRPRAPSSDHCAIAADTPEGYWQFHLSELTSASTGPPRADNPHWSVFIGSSQGSYKPENIIFNRRTGEPYRTYIEVFSAPDQKSADLFAESLKQGMEACGHAVRNYKVDPDKAIYHATALLDTGNESAGRQLFKAVFEAAKTPGTWNGICWWGALSGLAQWALPACDRAVTGASPESVPGVRDSRGVARALTGDLQGAATDIEFFVANFPAKGDPAVRVRRQRWIASLQAGKNPITPAEMEELRIE